MAVVGASTTPGKVGHDIFQNILSGGFTGVLYPVNPGARSVLSVRAYPTIKDIPDDLDLVFIGAFTDSALLAYALIRRLTDRTEARMVVFLLCLSPWYVFMAMSFMALEVIPTLKLTDRGLVDVERFDFVDLFAPDAV